MISASLSIRELYHPPRAQGAEAGEWQLLREVKPPPRRPPPRLLRPAPDRGSPAQPHLHADVPRPGHPREELEHLQQRPRLEKTHHHPRLHRRRDRGVDHQRSPDPGALLADLARRFHWGSRQWRPGLRRANQLWEAGSSAAAREPARATTVASRVLPAVRAIRRWSPRPAPADTCSGRRLACGCRR